MNGLAECRDCVNRRLLLLARACQRPAAEARLVIQINHGRQTAVQRHRAAASPVDWGQRVEGTRKRRTAGAWPHPPPDPFARLPADALKAALDALRRAAAL